MADQVTCPVCQRSDTVIRNGQAYLCNCICSWYEDMRRPDPRLAALKAERDRLREALANMLRSQDCAWEERSMGHDWPTACAQARAALEGNGNGN